MSECPLSLQEGNGAMQGVQDVVASEEGETLVVSQVQPHINVVRPGLRDVPKDPRLVCRRPAHAEALERVECGVDRLGGIMAGLQHREIVRHDLPAGLPQNCSRRRSGL